MVLANQPMTLNQFLAFDDGTETLYELEDGTLLPMPPESELNRRIAMMLLVFFWQQGIPSERLTMKTEIAISGSRSTVRLPDLTILSEELAMALEGASRSTVLLDMPPPDLVVEVVSPGKENEDRDYRYKRSEYGARRIPEYWIVDPIAQKVSVLELVNGFYEVMEYEGNRGIVSPLLGTLSLTASQVLREG